MSTVFGGKRIHSTLYWKGSIVSAGIRTPDPWVAYTTELSDLLMNGHKNSVYQVQNKLFIDHSGIRNCHNDKLWTIEMLCKNISNINISFHTCLFDKNVPRMLQQEGILSVLFFFFYSRVKWVQILWCKVIIFENRQTILYQ